MKGITISTRLRGLGLGLTILCMSCSDAPKSGNTSTAPHAVPALGVHTTAATSSSLSMAADGSSGSSWPDYSWAAAIQVPAGTQCTAHPVGVTDPARTTVVSADTDGELRFYKPQPSWGTQVTFDCTSGGTSLGQRTVDLGAPSTFTRRTSQDLEAKVAGTAPGLTGNLSTISRTDSLLHGYPPPPDPIAQPQLYNQWVQTVSQPMIRYDLIPVWDLGMRGAFGGDCSGSWTGFVQAAAGYVDPCTTNFPNQNTQLYDEYDWGTQFPNPSCVWGGGCQTLFWAGIGGAHEPFDGGEITSTLIQNGFLLTQNGVMAFWQFANASNSWQLAQPPSGWAAGDSVEVLGAGWNSDCRSGGQLSDSAPYACLEWFDSTRQQYALASYPNPGNGGGVEWWPGTTEFIAEVPAGSPGNASYNPTISAAGGAWDWNSNFHFDPGGGGTDEYIYQFQGNFNVAYWANSTQNNPVDPMRFYFTSH